MACTFEYNFNVTGDCSNLSGGSVTFTLTGGAPPFTIISPNSGTTITPLFLTTTTYTETGLPAGTYNYTIHDSCIPENIQYSINVVISSGTCVSISETQDTTCGLNNGSLTATTTNLYGNATFELYEQDGTYITSAISATTAYTFNSLGPGIYYVVADDGGGCTGKSETCIVKSSTTFSFGTYVINDSTCVPTHGAVYVTGQTGTPPYTYLWSNGSSLDYVTGLTSGSAWNVIVTDSLGCSGTTGGVIGSVPPLGIAATLLTTPPSCFSNDGEVTVTVTGGTPPYYFSGVNGDISVTFSTSYTFVGVSTGYFTVFVQDAGLCSDTDIITVLPPFAFTVLSVNITNSVCSNNQGIINVTVLGSPGFYTLTLTDSSSNSNVVTINSTYTTFTYPFTSLSSDTYTLTINNGGPCTYTGDYTVSNVDKFTVSTSVTGTTCNQENGSVTVTISSGGTPPYTYNVGPYNITNGLTSYTFTDLVAGNYTATVTDSEYCAQIIPFTITSSPIVDFILIGTDSVEGNDGQVQAFIIDGVPPFTWNWSSNVNGQTGLTVTNLSAGTYTLTVTDYNGCVKTISVTIEGFNKLTSYEILTICDDEFTNTGQLGKKGPQQYLIEGFYDLTSGDTNCILNQAIFSITTDINGVTRSESFYTGTTLNDFPLDNIYYDALKELLLTYPIVGEVIINELENKVTISTDCSTAENSNGYHVKVYLNINYDISCVSCESLPTPTPTITPTNTVTPTPTITPTNTVTPTPTITPTNTVTPTPTPAPNLDTCAVIYNDGFISVFYYDTTTNQSINLNLPLYNGSPDIAHTLTKLWAIQGGSSDIIQEWDITLSPFSATFNRTINVPLPFPYLGAGLCSKDNTNLTLIGSKATTGTNLDRIIEIDITNPIAVVTDKFGLDTDSGVAGDLIYTLSGKLIMTIFKPIDNFGYGTPYIQQWDYATGVKELEILLNPTIPEPYGLFVDNNELFIMGINSDVYKIDLLSPYTLTLVNNTGNLFGAYGASQVPSCNNVQFEI